MDKFRSYGLILIMKAFLGLSTGDIFSGKLFCAGDLSPGEVVLYHSENFHYQLLTDPVNYGRIIVSDSKTVENRWPHTSEIESYSPHLKALVVLGGFRDSPIQNEFYNLINYFRTNGITLFKPYDPANLNTVLKRLGSIKGMIAPDKDALSQLFTGKYSSSPPVFPDHNGHQDYIDPVRRLSTRLDFFWDLPHQLIEKDIERKFLVVAYDFGLRYSMLRNLKKLGCDIRIVPADYSPEEVIALKPEGILLSGGPGHPREMGYAISNISRLIGLRPILATGLGHILLGLSMGAKIEILKKPHFGGDIKIKREGQVLEKAITTQTHSVSINRESLEKDGFAITYTNDDDNTVEGYENRDYLIQSYAFPLSGNDDFTFSCLQNFVDLMEVHRAGKKLIK